MRDNVGLGLDPGLHSSRGKLFLQVSIVIEVNGGAELDRLRGLRADALLEVIAAQRLRRPTFFDNERQGEIFVVNDLLVVEQLEETIVRDLFHRLHPSAIKQHGEGNETEGDRDEDDAAPVEIRLGTAGFILLLRIAIGLGHKECGVLTAGWKR